MSHVLDTDTLKPDILLQEAPVPSHKSPDFHYKGLKYSTNQLKLTGMIIMYTMHNTKY
jgi:hypothetical protein